MNKVQVLLKRSLHCYMGAPIWSMRLGRRAVRTTEIRAVANSFALKKDNEPLSND